MRFLILGDLHLRYRAPANRIDDFWMAQWDKMNQVFDLVKKHDCCEWILQPGDLFHRPDPANITVYSLMRVLHKENIYIAGVLGQHDVFHRRFDDLSRTGIGILEAGLCWALLESNKPFVPSFGKPVEIYGRSFEQELPSKMRPIEGLTRILVAHMMVGNKILYPFQKLRRPERLIQEMSDFDLIVLGDYHYPFHTELDGRHVINVGALTRQSIAKRDRSRTPQVAIYDTEAKSVETLQLKCKPVEEIFDLSKPDGLSREDTEILNEFLKKLKETGKLSVSFDDNLQTIMDKEETPSHIKTLVLDIVQTANEDKKDD